MAAELLHFVGEVEVVFGLWAIVLLVAMVGHLGMAAATHYFNDTVNYTEPLFVVVIMALASSRPVVGFAEAALGRVAGLGRGTPTAWWLSILTIGPVLGSFITEPAAMTICALLLGRQFYDLQPSTRLKYATLGLLFVNVSIGGTLTHFAAPPVLMVARHLGLGHRLYDGPLRVAIRAGDPHLERHLLPGVSSRAGGPGSAPRGAGRRATRRRGRPHAAGGPAAGAGLADGRPPGCSWRGPC